MHSKLNLYNICIQFISVQWEVRKFAEVLCTDILFPLAREYKKHSYKLTMIQLHPRRLLVPVPWFQMGREVCKLLKEQSQPPRERWQPFDGNRSPIQRILEGTPCPQFVPLHLQCRHQLPSVRLDTPIRNKPELKNFSLWNIINVDKLNKCYADSKNSLMKVWDKPPVHTRKQPQRSHWQTFELQIIILLLK